MRRVISPLPRRSLLHLLHLQGAPCEMSLVPLGDITDSDHESVILLLDLPRATMGLRQPVTQ